MTLKPYDLLWVVGKSAAWRYPGEIPELKSFAPPVPEQAMDLFYKKKDPDKTNAEISTGKKSEPVNGRTKEINTQRVSTSRSVYVNLPADKKPAAVIHQDRVLFEMETHAATEPEPVYDFSDLFRKKSYRSARISGKVLWISTIALLFGAGLLTGLFISDRRKFFSTAVNHPQDNNGAPTVVLVDQKKISPSPQTNSLQEKKTDEINNSIDSVQKTNTIVKKPANKTAKKNLNPVASKPDVVDSQRAILMAVKLKDSLKQNAFSKSEMIIQKIKAHPENYIGLEAGRYSTGMFGGISSFPVTVTNNSPVMLDVVVVSVNYIQNNEKVFKTESLIFNNLEPGEIVTLKAPKSPRGVKISTRIQTLTPRQPDLSNSN